MKKQFKLLFVILMIVFGMQSFSQRVTNVDTLNRLSTEFSNNFMVNKSNAIEFAKQNSLLIKNVGIELTSIDTLDFPTYYTTDNVNAATTISTNKVYTNGGYGFSLNGTGQTLRFWDEGKVLNTHQEFGSRITQVDNSTTLSNHATHVAGTLIASGVVSNVKGMAFNANLNAFDWSNDVSEMAIEAANNTLISNHSYGIVCGWRLSGGVWNWYGNPTISTLEDYRFGFYDNGARNFDIIANNAPYYLICKSAGNDRNEGPTNGQYPNDGLYDCISSTGVGKNVLTIGSVNDIVSGYSQPSDVVLHSISGCGPTDDGRIKPDIVGNGTGVYSTSSTSNTSYTYYTGTSQSTPSVAGSLSLLQEHYYNTYYQYMLASTLKALAIHTANEAGTTAGPDYQFGWGLMNTLKATQKISEDNTINVIDEINLTSTYTRDLYSDGTTPLKVTIVWNDVAGTPTTPSLDPTTPMLINDLNLKLVSNNVTYYPWKLDGANPTNAATRNSKNHVDNVEQVLIDNPQAGIYQIVVDYDNTLTNGLQTFSIIISGISTQLIGSTIQGTLSYDNVATTPMALDYLNIKQNNTVLSQSQVNSNGDFSFNNLSNGTYTIEDAIIRPWGGANSVDALLVLKHSVGLVTLSGLKKTAADVNNDGSVNSSDALLIAKRYTELISSFTAGDWAFDDDVINITQQSIINKTYYTLAYGDVNASYNFNQNQSTYVNLTSLDDLSVNQYENVILPIYTETALNFNAFSLTINIPKNCVVDSLVIPNKRYNDDNLIYKVINNKLYVIWYDLNSLQFSSNEQIFKIYLDIPYENFELSIDDGKFYDYYAAEIRDITLYYPRPTLYWVSDNSPNPSSNITYFNIYTFEDESEVDIVVRDIDENIVYQDTRQITKGITTLSLNLNSFDIGTYHCDINVDGRFDKRNDIIVVR